MTFAGRCSTTLRTHKALSVLGLAQFSQTDSQPPASHTFCFTAVARVPGPYDAFGTQQERMPDQVFIKVRRSNARPQHGLAAIQHCPAYAVVAKSSVETWRGSQMRHIKEQVLIFPPTNCWPIGIRWFKAHDSLSIVLTFPTDSIVAARNADRVLSLRRPRGEPHAVAICFAQIEGVATCTSSGAAGGPRSRTGFALLARLQ